MPSNTIKYLQVKNAQQNIVIQDYDVIFEQLQWYSLYRIRLLKNDLSTGDEVKVVVLYIETAYDIAEQLPLNLACDGKTFAMIRNINPDFEYKRRMERRSIFSAWFKF